MSSPSSSSTPVAEQKYPKLVKSKDPASRPSEKDKEENIQFPDDNQFVPLKHILDRWLVCADYITQEGSDLYHANLAALACLKDVYMMDNVTWEGLRDKVYVGIIKDDKEYGTSSVSMGVAVQYFESKPTANKVLILNCGTGGTKYGLYVREPNIHEIHKSDGGSKDGQISCLEIEGVGYNPRSYGLAFSSKFETVQKSLGKEKQDAIDKCGKKWEADIEAIAFITGSIRGYYSKTSRTEKITLDERITGLFHSIGVNCVPGEINDYDGKSTFFLSQDREGELELVAVQALHRNLANASKILKRLVPVVSLGIGRGTAQWAMKGEILGHDAGMNNIPQLAQLGHFICKKLQGRTLKLFLKNVAEQTSQGNYAVIALKSGCTLAFTSQIPNFIQLKKKFLKLEPPPQPPSAHSLTGTLTANMFLSAANSVAAATSLRLFLAQNGNPDIERVAWKKPSSLTTIDALCAYASKLLNVNENFIAVYHENGSRIRDLDNIASEDLLFFSRGEPFGAPPGLPTVADKKLTLKLTPLGWICDRWLLGHETSDRENEIDKNDEKITHASLSTLKEIWYYNSLEWNEIRDKVHVCFEEDLDLFLSRERIEYELKNEIVSQKDDPNDVKLTEEEKVLKRVTTQFEERKKFLKINLVETLEIKEEMLNFCSLDFPIPDFPKFFVEKLKEARDVDGRMIFDQLMVKINGAKFPFFLLTKRAFPLLYPLAQFNQNSRNDRKRNDHRALLRTQFCLPLHEPPVAPQPIRVYFGLNSESDGNAFRVSPNWTLSRVCAEAVQVLCPGKYGMLFTRVFNRAGFEIQPVNVLYPVGMKEEDTLFFSFGEDYGEEVSGVPVKCSVPAIPVFSIRKLADIDISTGRINVVFDFTLLVPREGVPKEVRRDGFLVTPIRVSVNSEPFELEKPTSVIIKPPSATKKSSFGHILPPGSDKGVQFYKWKARPTLNIGLNSCDDELHNAIRDCPFDVHILHFVVEMKPIRTRGYKVAFDMHFMKRGCIVRDKEKVDYLPEFDVDWQTSRVELATRVPLGVEKKQWTESCFERDRQSDLFLCVGQEELMSGITTAAGDQETDPKWLDRVGKDERFKVGTGCNCMFRELHLPLTSQDASFSDYVSCPKKVILDLADINEACRIQKELVAASSSFGVLHFSVLIRRDPTLLTLLAVFPVFLLCLLALAIVWQPRGFTDSIANIAAVLLALFAYSPVVRGRLPPSPSITAVDKLLNYAILVCFVVLITAVIQEAISQEYSIKDDNEEEIIVGDEVAKLYLARISLISSVIISIGHFFVFCYFFYKTIQHGFADRRQTIYIGTLDQEEAREEKLMQEERLPPIARLPSRMISAISERKQGSIQLSQVSRFSRQGS